MIIRKDIDLNTPLTVEQAEMLEALADRPVTPDEDCPELTPAQIAQFKQIAAVNREGYFVKVTNVCYSLGQR